jgi:hypothetical protein
VLQINQFADGLTFTDCPPDVAAPADTALGGERLEPLLHGAIPVRKTN